jgi:hypothetical protein
MVSNPARLQEVLRLAADTIEGLYEQLKRQPPMEGARLIRELQDFQKELSN